MPNLLINIKTGQKFDAGSLGWLHPGGNPYTVPDALAIQMVDRGIADPLNWPANTKAALTDTRNVEEDRLRYLVENGVIKTSDGAIYTLSELMPTPTRLTASGQVGTGPQLVRGFELVTVAATPVSIRLYDGTSTSGTLRKTFTASALGYYYVDGDGVTPGNGRGGRLPFANGCYAEFVGATARTADFSNEAF